MAKQKKINNLADLTPDNSNANKGTERGRYMVEASLTEVGAGRSILVDAAGNVIAGNKTLEAWASMGGEVEVVQTDGHKLVVVQRTDLDLHDTTGKARKLAYYDNRAGQVGLEWDTEQLLADVNAGVDLSAMFKDDELKELLADVSGGETSDGDAEPQTDRAEELRAKWGTETGQLWRIGEHRLLCGDSTRREDVERVMGGEKAELLFTSPPYADMRDYKDGVDVSVEKLAQFIPAFRLHVAYQVVNLGIKRDKGEVVQYWDTYIKEARACGYKLLSWNVWDQGNASSVGKITAMFPIEHEWIFVFGEKTKDLTPTVPNKNAGYENNHIGDRGKDGVVKKKDMVVIRDKRELGTIERVPPMKARNTGTSHPAMFPTQIVDDYLCAMTKGGDIVAEPFAGSGTTLVACQQLGRKCRAIEISPAYCAVILERMKAAFPLLEIELCQPDDRQN